MNTKYFCLVFICTLFIFSTTTRQEPAHKVVKTFHIASSGGWDYIAVNNNKLYVSHSNQVNILDENTGDSIGFIPNTPGVHGIAFDNELNRGYTSNGRSDNITVFDLKTNKIITKIPAGENPDAIMFEPYTKKIITNNGRSHNLSIIDPLSNKQIGKIELNGKPEEAVADGEGKLYVNLEDKNEIAVVSLKTFKVEKRWSLLPGEGPTGLAMDIKSKRLFSACSDSKLLVVMDAENGRIIDKLKIGGGCDGAAFDPENKLIFLPNGADGTITIVKERSANEFAVTGNIITKRGARTITRDKKTGMLFLPTAEFEPADPADPKGRPGMKPGTFQVLAVQ